MSDQEFLFQDYYDRDGNLIGVWINASLWNKIKTRIEPEIKNAIESSSTSCPVQESQEPLNDWNLLKKFWDFKYPVDMDVYCEHCGNQTDNWQQDNPRKFILKAANLGGLVTFQCLHCSSRIMKKHFKDHIKIEIYPVSK